MCLQLLLGPRPAGQVHSAPFTLLLSVLMHICNSYTRSFFISGRHFPLTQQVLPDKPADKL